MRANVVVREATPDDLPDLLALWAEQRSLTTRSERIGPEPSVAGALETLARAQRNPDTRVVLATMGETVVGTACS